MQFQGVEPICHSIGTSCNRRRIYVSDILEGKVQLQSQHIQEVQKSEYQDEAFQLESTPKQLSAKQAAQLVWHSFRFSNGYPPLQFTMMYQAWKKYGDQEMSVEECGEAFFGKLKVGETHSTTTIKEWKEPNWRPPHPKINRSVTTIEHGTDIGLSDSRSHGVITKKLIDEGIEPIKMLLTGEGYLTRSAGRDGDFKISRSKSFEYKGQVIEDMFKRDFKYLLKTEDRNKRQSESFGRTWDEYFPGRPNRRSENDGSNNLKDRYFSYFIWYIIKDNSTGSDFFDEYFGELHSFFTEWFRGLPTDSELEDINRKGLENKSFYNSLRPHREGFNNSYSSRSDRKITKEDVLMFIARYNATHPDTQVDLESLGLSQHPAPLITP